MDQTEREDGVKSHLKKAGTPTMGGVMILFAIAVTSLIYVREYPKVIPVLFVTIGFGLVGFLDDYLKVVLHRSDGLMPMQKMALQIVITAIFAFYIVKVAKIPLTMLIPFSGGKYLNIEKEHRASHSHFFRTGKSYGTFATSYPHHLSGTCIPQ